MIEQCPIAAIELLRQQCMTRIQFDQGSDLAEGICVFHAHIFRYTRFSEK